MKKRNDQFYDVLLCHVLLCYFVRLFVLVILLRYSRFFDLTNASFLAFSHIRPKLFVFRRTISLQLRIFFFFRYFDNKHIFKSPGFVTQVCTHTHNRIPLHDSLQLSFFSQILLVSIVRHPIFASFGVSVWLYIQRLLRNKKLHAHYLLFRFPNTQISLTHILIVSPCHYSFKPICPTVISFTFTFMSSLHVNLDTDLKNESC